MTLQATFARLRERLQAQIIGQEGLIEHLLIALLADGHALLEGAPGLAKTRAAKLLADAFKGDFSRIQFTPDLLPSDLIGTAILDPTQSRFTFQKGPLFGQFILADEINRAPAKVQSALLEAMEERQITSGEHSYPLPQPFFVVATQNPIEHEGTWELPQAQLDRFLLHITVPYPTTAAERRILDLVMEESLATRDRQAGRALDPAPLKIETAALNEAKGAVLEVHVSPLIKDDVVRLVAATRSQPVAIAGVGEHLDHPVSPRGSIALTRAAQARAWLSNRDHVLPDDLAALAHDVLRHRMGLSYRAEAEGVRADDVIDTLLERVLAA